MLACLVFALCASFIRSQMVPVPESALTAIVSAGIQTISSEIKSANAELEAAVEAFKPINASCSQKINANIPVCTQCVKDKCRTRAESVCKPEQWQVVLGKTIGFFKDGIPNFFKDTIPDVFVNKIGGGVVDVTKDIGNFFEDKIGGGIINIGKTIGGGVVDLGKGVVDFGKGIGNKVVDLGKKVGSGVVDAGKTIGKGVTDAVDKIKDFGSKIGGAFKDVFGIGKRELKHEEFIRSRRNGEPGCSDFENDADKACRFYLSPSYCSACKFDANTQCPGYQAAINRIKEANNGRQWMSKIKDQQYKIISMTFNPTAVNGAGSFTDVDAKVYIFGLEVSFKVQTPINPYIANVAGPVIAQQAFDLFKKT